KMMSFYGGLVKVDLPDVEVKKNDIDHPDGKKVKGIKNRAIESFETIKGKPRKEKKKPEYGGSPEKKKSNWGGNPKEVRDVLAGLASVA
ncbi:MAG: hypothetical protein ACKO96_19945, partial [Flammeovirgaceae bacterium]